jgi:hypothetical protein
MDKLTLIKQLLMSMELQAKDLLLESEVSRNNILKVVALDRLKQIDKVINILNDGE